MKKLLFSLFLLLTANTAVWAQSPQRMSYQSIIRDGSNVVVASSPVGIKISVLRGTATGTAVYVETHRKTTNANGLVSLEIGEGTALLGTFAGIDWANGPYLIKTETDPTGGTNYSIPGIAPLNSVPYALYAANGTPGPKGDKGDTGATGPAGLQGPTGLPGVAGLPGVVGPQGATGSTGAAGAQGIQGAIGIAGSAGTDGVNGANGLDGKTVLNGTSNPTNQGVDGDFYINTTSNTIFGPKASGVWPTGISLVGPIGATGIQGIQGIQGAAGSPGANGTNGLAGSAGTDGVNGTNGLDGKTVLNGTSNPTSQGVDGDFYINTTSNTIFGPKASGVWPSGVSLIGIASIGTISGTSTANGATITSGELKLAPANGTNGGIVTTGAQTFAGAKTFSSDLAVNGLTVGRGGGGKNSNVAVGINALPSNHADAAENTAIGYAALINQNSSSARANTAVGFQSLEYNLSGQENSAFGHNALQTNTASYNTAIGSTALQSNTTGTYNTAIGKGSDVGSGALTNATAIGSGAIVLSSDAIQLGNASVTTVSTAGTLTAGDVTYPKLHGTANQVLSTTGSGTLAWTTPAAGLPTSGNTAGDMLYWNGTVWVRVAASRYNDTYLQSKDGVPTWTLLGRVPTEIVEVTNPITGEIWMDRNLGATQVATGSDDAASFGGLYQWGRGTDGHQIVTSGTTSVLSSSDTPENNGQFILKSTTPRDWRFSPNSNLWQGLNGINNPCPTGFRIPTESEWDTERTSWSNNNSVGALASPLKLPMGGYRYSGDGNTRDRSDASFGYYWSSTVSGNTDSHFLYFYSSGAGMTFDGRADGFSVRCIKD